MAIKDPGAERAAVRRLLERDVHTTAVCNASRTETGPLAPERLAEIIAADEATCGTDAGFFSGYSMTHVDRHDLLRHIRALAASTPATTAPIAAPGACTVCGCTPDRRCDDGCDDYESSLEVRICALCSWAIARDAIAAGIYRPTAAECLIAGVTAAPDGALF